MAWSVSAYSSAPCRFSGILACASQTKQTRRLRSLEWVATAVAFEKDDTDVLPTSHAQRAR